MSAAGRNARELRTSSISRSLPGVGVLRKIDDVADQGAGLEGDAHLGAKDDLRVERGPGWP